MNDVRNIEKIIRNMNLYCNKKNKNKQFSQNQFEIIRYTVKHPGLKLVDLVTYLNVDKALITRNIKKIIALGYLRIEEDKNDHRVKRLYPEKLAFEIKIEEADNETYFLYKCLESLTEKEKIEYLELTNKVYELSKAYRKKGFSEL